MKYISIKKLQICGFLWVLKASFMRKIYIKINIKYNNLKMKCKNNAKKTNLYSMLVKIGK